MSLSSDKEDLIYLAGFLDGEGCFTIYREKISVTCANTYKPIIDWMKSSFGGTISTRKARKENHRVCYSWHLVANNARELLEKLVPYLREKKPQALMLLTYQQLTKAPKIKRKVNPLVVEERKRLEKLLVDMKRVSW